MIHMHAIPAAPAQRLIGRPRIAYLTNTEVDNSGKVRAIHSHADITEIGLVYEGCGVHIIDGREYRSKPGDLVLYNTDVLHQDLSCSGGESMRFFLCGVAGLHLAGLPSGHIAAGPSNYVIQSGMSFPFLLHGFEALERGLLEQSSQTSAFAPGLFTVVARCVGDCPFEYGPQPVWHATGQSFAGRGNTAVYRSELYAEFYPGGTCRPFPYQPILCSHIFSDTFHCSLMQYRTRRRVGEAQSLLTSTDCSVHKYCQAWVGYDDPNRFSQVFSKL